MTKYEIILYWSVDDDAFIAEVPELPGCAADGPTRHEALANAVGQLSANQSGKQLPVARLLRASSSLDPRLQPWGINPGSPAGPDGRWIPRRPFLGKVRRVVHPARKSFCENPL